jgi:cell wall assembly regulator SMI1
MPKQVKLSFRRSAPGRPSAAKEAWKRLKAWFKGNLPEVLEDLNPGATSEEVKRFEQAVGHKLPAEVRLFYRTHNGQRCGWNVPGVVYGLPILSLQDCLTQWRSWEKGRRRSQGKGGPSLDDICASFPEGAVQVKYTSPSWIPLSYDGSGNHFGVDLAPGPKGSVGQVINFGRDEEHHCVLAPSWGQFLNDLADELERGNYRIEERADGYKAFNLLDPHVGHFLQAGLPWSRAKLGKRRLTGHEADQWEKSGWSHVWP